MLQDAIDQEKIRHLRDHRGHLIPVLAVDYHFIVLNKPHNMLSVPAHSDHLGASLLTQLLTIFPEIRCVHRLDYETSGVMVFARGKKAERMLFAQFRNRQVQKKYWAICHQPPDALTGEIDLMIGKDDPSSPFQRTTAVKRKHAKTLWRHRGGHDNLWLAELHPITGRTHQLRVHLSAIGSPILNDPLYAPFKVGTQKSEPLRLYLHAADLHFSHPVTQQPLHFSCLPSDVGGDAPAIWWQHFMPTLTSDYDAEVL